MIGGTFKIVVRGRGINLSLVGKGTITLNGAGTGADGSYSVNGGDYSAMPDFPVDVLPVGDEPLRGLA